MGFKEHLQAFEKFGEIGIIEKYISNGDMVFDVGSNIGAWSKVVLDRFPGTKIHMFEPVDKHFRKRLPDFVPLIKRGQVVANRVAVSNIKGTKKLYVYLRLTDLSSFYPRSEDVVKFLKLNPPNIERVSTITLNDYCRNLKIRHINFLKIDVEGAEFEVLRGASDLLISKGIDYIQFEYGGNFKDAQVTLCSVLKYMFSKGYEVFKFSADSFVPITKFSPVLEDYKLSNFLAISPKASK